MQTCCLGCKKTHYKYWFKTITMTNKVIRHKSRCANCISDELRLLKQKSNKSGWNDINPKLFIY